MDVVDVGSRIMFGLGIYMVVMSIFWVTITETMFLSDFAAYTGQNLSEHRESSPKTAEIYIITKKLIGVELLLVGVLVALISHNAFSKGEKWSWFALLIAGIMTWGVFIAYRILIGYWASVGIIPFLIGFVLFLVGITIPARRILGKTTKSAL
jgi:hypothetical protein